MCFLEQLHVRLAIIHLTEPSIQRWLLAFPKPLMSKPVTSQYSGDSTQSMLDPALSAGRSSGSTISNSEVDAGAMSASFYWSSISSSWSSKWADSLSITLKSMSFSDFQSSLLFSLTWTRTQTAPGCCTRLCSGSSIHLCLPFRVFLLKLLDKGLI